MKKRNPKVLMTFFWIYVTIGVSSMVVAFTISSMPLLHGLLLPVLMAVNAYMVRKEATE